MLTKLIDTYLGEMNSTLITIIVPVYNIEKYLGYCVDSILSQSYPYFELLLIDDGSKDKSPAICDEYAAKDQRVKVIHKENGGVSAARNSGLDIATGDYICFVDSDDYVHSEMLQTLVEVAQREKCDFVTALEENVYKIELYRTQESQSKSERQGISQGELMEGVFHSQGEEKLLYYHIHSKLYSRKCIGDIRFDKTISLSEDLLFNFQVFCNMKKGAVVRQPLYYRTVLRADSLSSGGSWSLINNANVFLHIYHLLPAELEKYKGEALTNIMQRLAMYKCTSRYTEEFEKYKDLMHRVYSEIKSDYCQSRAIPLKEKVKWTILYNMPFIYDIIGKNRG